jgi:putative YphP/YqiW family bacilliredoxin
MRVKPDKVATVFAGADIEATERARGYFSGMGHRRHQSRC